MTDLADAFPTRDHTFYGRSAVVLGEDGDAWMAAGHDRRSYAAINAVARYDGGTRPFLGLQYTITRSWTLFAETCGCTAEEHRLHGEDIPEGVAEGSPEAEAYDECWAHCEHSGLPPCSDEYGWVTFWCDEGTPDAVPVLYVRIDWRATDAASRRRLAGSVPEGSAER